MLPQDLLPNNSAKKVSPIVILFIMIQLLFIVLLVISFLNLRQSDGATDRKNEPKVTIDGLTAKIKDFPNSYTDDIEHSLTETIELNVDNFNISNVEAVIRDNSLKVKDFYDYGFKALSVIVDIPNLEQSYQIFYKYSTDYENIVDSAYYDNPRAVLCLSEEMDKIYPNFKCQASYPQETRFKIVADYLKYLDFNYFSAFTDDSLTKIIINPTEYSPTDEEKASYLQETKNAIESLGISPEIFTYEVSSPSDLTYRIYD